MARALKTRGLVELGVLRQRVRRQLLLGRITTPDHDKLVGLLNEFEAHVIKMDEKEDV